MTDPALLRRVLGAVRAAVTNGRETVPCGPFDLYREPRGGALASYAIPREGASPSPADVAALRDAFRVVGRPTRIEYLPQLAPDVEAAALAGGFEVELRSPLMTRERGTEVAVPACGATLERVTPESDDATIIALVQAQDEAFGAQVGRVDAQVWRARHAGIWLLARAQDGTPAGGGCVTKPDRGAAEVAAIGVIPAYRRRGIAGAVTAELARRAFDAGIELLFLTPGGKSAQRIYERAGFAAVGEALHLRAEI